MKNNSKERTAKFSTTDVFQQLTKGVEDCLASDKWRNFLKFSSKFHQYSFNNRLLIQLQKDNATYVAPTGVWIKNGYGPKKGESGLHIFSKPFSYEKEEDGNLKRGTYFRVETVFDISQICVWNEEKAAKNPLPKICERIQGNTAEELYNFYKDNEPWKVLEVNKTDGSIGSCCYDDELITIEKTLNFDHKFKTLLHEKAHKMFHSYDEEQKLMRDERELEAESVAFIVCNYFDIDTSEYSFEYLSSWGEDKAIDKLKKLGKNVIATAQELIDSYSKVETEEV